jgi:hypothetical protein
MTNVQNISVEDQSKKFASRNAIAAAGVGVAGTLALAPQANAQTTPESAISDITSMVTGLGLIAGAALAVALAPRAIGFAMKIIGRVMT